MSTVYDGGPAFPCGREWHEDRSGVSRWEENGMSLRDYAAIHTDMDGLRFPSIHDAAKFMGEKPPDSDNTMDVLMLSMRVEARLRYMKADAMLAARKENTR